MSGKASGLTEAELRELAARGAAELAGASATELLRWTDEHFGGVRGPRALDTGYHFVETIGTRDAIEAVYDIRVLNVTPEHTVAEQDELLGKDLFARQPNECCRLRKVAPLSKALRGYSAWVTGLRRVEAPTRANAPLISFDEVFGLVKINPLAAWTDQDMQNYIDENDVLVNPLVYEGYPSIGCAPCTAKVADGADPRSGRWQGLSKTECGLHAS
jgi:phosphoadenosine phosphosulfate reductase